MSRARILGLGALLGLLFLSDCLLTFLWADTPYRLWVFSLGMVLPLALWTASDDRRFPLTGLVQGEGPWAPGLLGAGLIFLAAFLLRAYRIDSLFLWPTGDEALIGQAALELSQGGEGRFFHTVGQNPPLFVWLCATFFKLFQDPLFCLYAPAALVSCLTLAAGYWTLKPFTSRSFAFWFAALLAFSYWPLYLGRRCLPAVMPPLGEFLALGCLLQFMKAKQKGPWAFGAGLCAGLQSLTYVSWPVVLLACAAVFARMTWDLSGKRTQAVLLFSLGVLGGLFPFLWAVHQEGYGQHIQALGHQTDWYRYGGVLERTRRYGEALLFRLPGEGKELGSPGGLLNPFLGPFFLIGLAQVWRCRKHPYGWLLLGVLVLFLAPGVLSLNLQTFRVVQALPLVLAVTALGWWTLVKGLPKAQGAFLLGAVLLAGALFDWARLTGPYEAASSQHSKLDPLGRSAARYEAFLEWKERSKGMGPGILLGEWDLWADRTLDLVVHPFNACRGPLDLREGASWMGILADARYGPFLRQVFPTAQWKRPEGGFPGGSYLLGTVIIGEKERPMALRWARADSAFRSINQAVDRVLDKDILLRVDRDIRDGYPLIQGDRLLESLYWEKVAEFYYYHGGRPQENLRALEWAWQRGVPAPHLKEKLQGLRSLLQGRAAGASPAGEGPRSR